MPAAARWVPRRQPGRQCDRVSAPNTGRYSGHHFGRPALMLEQSRTVSHVPRG